jgi:hypothetical protein
MALVMSQYQWPDRSTVVLTPCQPLPKFDFFSVILLMFIYKFKRPWQSRAKENESNYFHLLDKNPKDVVK